MAAGLPELTMAGTLVADPELRFTPAGAAVVNFTVACNSRRKNEQTGEWEDADATFLRCTIWRQPAENIAESLIKGDRVMVTGSLKQRSYETRDGEKRTVYEVDASEVGASTKFATVKATRAGRSSASRSSRADAGDDPWGSAPPKGAPVQDEEPPF